jgi:hypothetical protein
MGRRQSELCGLAIRASILVVVAWFVSLDHNPIVALNSQLGLSPSLMERVFGIKGIFSGMTEGMFRLSRGEIEQSMAANVLTPFFAIAVVGCVIAGVRPRIKTKTAEWIVIFSTVLLVFIVNITSPLQQETSHSALIWALIERIGPTTLSRD